MQTDTQNHSPMNLRSNAVFPSLTLPPGRGSASVAGPCLWPTRSASKEHPQLSFGCAGQLTSRAQRWRNSRATWKGITGVVTVSPAWSISAGEALPKKSWPFANVNDYARFKCHQARAGCVGTDRVICKHHTPMR